MQRTVLDWFALHEIQHPTIENSNPEKGHAYYLNCYQNFIKPAVRSAPSTRLLAALCHEEAPGIDPPCTRRVANIVLIADQSGCHSGEKGGGKALQTFTYALRSREKTILTHIALPWNTPTGLCAAKETLNASWDPTLTLTSQ